MSKKYKHQIAKIKNDLTQYVSRSNTGLILDHFNDFIVGENEFKLPVKLISELLTAKDQEYKEKQKRHLISAWIEFGTMFYGVPKRIFIDSVNDNMIFNERERLLNDLIMIVQKVPDQTFQVQLEAKTLFITYMRPSSELLHECNLLYKHLDELRAEFDALMLDTTQ